jgi:hypothetical protein
MKRSWIPAVILGACLLVALPSPGFTGNGHYYGGHGGHGHSNGNYWGTAAVIAGGVVLGTAIAATVFAPPRYVVREPVYAYPSAGYAYADPGYASQPPPGVWRTVPGQWINGRWVPAHQVWVPVNPY